jgi:hypothetical protein
MLSMTLMTPLQLARIATVFDLDRVGLAVLDEVGDPLCVLLCGLSSVARGPETLFGQGLAPHFRRGAGSTGIPGAAGLIEQHHQLVEVEESFPFATHGLWWLFYQIHPLDQKLIPSILVVSVRTKPWSPAIVARGAKAIILRRRAM